MNTQTQRAWLLLCYLVSPTVLAANLADIYQIATANDPTILQAKASQLQAHEYTNQMRAPLLPQLAVSDTASKTHTSLTSEPAAVTDVTSSGSTTANTYTGTYSQTVFDLSSWQTYRASRNNEAQANAIYRAAEQSLIQRTIQLYVSVLNAEDVVRFTTAKKRAIKRELDQARQRYEVGLDTQTSVYEAEAAYASATASTIAAQNAVSDAREQLREMTGRTYRQLAIFKRDMSLALPAPANIEAWVNKAKINNLSVIAAQFATAEAEDTVKAERAKHLPTVSASLSYSHATSDNERSADTTTKATSGSVTLSLPIFSGGSVMAAVRSAQYAYQSQLASLESSLRQAIIQTRQDYLGLTAIISQAKADKQTVKSQLSALKGAEAELEVGTKTVLDVLDAQQKLFEAQTNYANDIYSYILDYANLLQDTGELKPEFIDMVNNWLVPA